MSQQQSQRDGNSRGAFDRRVDALDQHIGTLGQRMGKVEQGMERFAAWSESMGELVREIKRGQDRLEERQSNSGRLNYGWVAAFVSVGLLIASTVGGLALNPVKEALSRHDLALERHTDALLQTLTTRFTRDDGEAQEERLVTELNRLRDRVSEHQGNGHPHTVLDKIAALEKLLDETRAEQRK